MIVNYKRGTLNSMNFVVNGESKTIDEKSVSIKDLLKKLNVETPEMVSVQLNGVFIDQKEHDAVQLKTNDEIDFLYFMGGGK
jgi:sulfur carrier protein